MFFFGTSNGELSLDRSALPCDFGQVSLINFEFEKVILRHVIGCDVYLHCEMPQRVRSSNNYLEFWFHRCEFRFFAPTLLKCVTLIGPTDKVLNQENRSRCPNTRPESPAMGCHSKPIPIICVCSIWVLASVHPKLESDHFQVGWA